MPQISDLGDLFDRLPVALYRTAPGGALLAGNTALAGLLAYESVEAMQEEVEAVASTYIDPGRRLVWLDQMETNGVVHDFDVELRRRDGTTVWVQDTARAVRDEQGVTKYYEGALIDVSEKVHAKKAKDEFLATVSHELRNPIAVVIGLGDELANRYESFTDVERREMAQLISRQAEDCSWLIDDLLVAYRDDVGQVGVVTQAFDIVVEVERVLEVVDHPVKVEVGSGEVLVDADPRRTRQIIRNLVTNALRYGGDEVVISLEHIGDRIELSVCDNGRPIAADDVERIFKPFERGAGPAHPKSVGLGLAVGRRLARLMQGDLIYRHVGGMSCFVLSLPAA